MGERLIRRNRPDLRAIIRDLSVPLHGECLRDFARGPRRGEVDLSRGYRIAGGGPPAALATAFEDFARFMRVVMAVPRRAQSGYALTWTIGPAGRLRDPESFRVEVAGEGCRIGASDAGGLRRALVFLEDEMLARRAPCLPLGRTTRRAVIRVRISRSPVATYRWGGGWELENGADHYPEAYLNRLAHAGINAVWVAGFFRNLIATGAIPEIGPHRTRLQRLARLVRRAARYGIKVYFFCMEPRLMEEKAVFQKYPDIRGATYPLESSRGETQLCTSSPRVQAYLREATAELFRRAPGLAGLIDIFQGERGTNCWMTGANLRHPTLGCSRCARRPVHEGLAELLRCFEDGMRSVNPEGEILAWDYAPTPEKLRVIERVGPRTVWLSCFEHGGRKTICGMPRRINEYSLSYVGPSTIYRQTQRLARRHGKPLYAKLQLGNTYEMSAMPYVPVPGSVYGKFRAMQRISTRGAMVSWIIGGFPSPMLKAAGEASFAPLAGPSVFLRRLAAVEWGEGAAAPVVRAWRHFFRAFDQYPMNNEVFYYGPITRSPAYHLALTPEPRLAKPYNWGWTTEREFQPFEDDPRRWCGTFTPVELMRSFRAMAREWAVGVAHLEAALRRLPASAARENPARQVVVARAVGIQFASCANVIEFYRLRRRIGRGSSAASRRVCHRMHAVAADDVRLALEMKTLLRQDPTLGFHSEVWHFSFSRGLLDAKIRQVRCVLPILGRRAGITRG